MRALASLGPLSEDADHRFARADLVSRRDGNVYLGFRPRLALSEPRKSRGEVAERLKAAVC